MTEKTVLLEKNDKICTLVLNRPDKMNAMNNEMLQSLWEAVDQIAADHKTHVVILKGAGDNFSSGADMALLSQEISSHEWLQGMKRVGEIVRKLREMPQPIVCQLRGVAYGAGANLALTGDFVIATETARFCEIFIHVGVILDFGGTYHLPRLVGLAKARELALLGNEIDGKNAASIGLIHKSVSEENLEQEVEAIAANLAQKPLAALALIKKGLNESFNKSLEEVLEWEAAHQSVMFQTPEHKEIVNMFIASKGDK
jgi:enoyl-CoA hydratase/carnithine racemase